MSTHKNAHKLDGSDGKSDRPVRPSEPTLEQIRERAYEVYVQRGRTDGFDIEDWLQAEKELRQNGKEGAE